MSKTKTYNFSSLLTTVCHKQASTKNKLEFKFAFKPHPCAIMVLRLLVCLVLLLFSCSTLVKDKTSLIKGCSWQTSTSELPWPKMSLSLAQISQEKKDVRQFWRYSCVKSWLDYQISLSLLSFSLARINFILAYCRLVLPSPLLYGT